MILCLSWIFALAIGCWVALFAIVYMVMSQSQLGLAFSAIGFTGGVIVTVVSTRRIRSFGTHALLADEPEPAQKTPQSVEKKSDIKYEDVEWGIPEPTRKQFEYALSLRVQFYNGMNRWTISEAIDTAIQEIRACEPASQEQLEAIERMHGVLKRAVSWSEAEEIIEYLDDYELPCPHCKIPVFATDSACCACGKSLRKMKIMIKPGKLRHKR